MKKIDKANADIELADNLIEEANQLYLETFSVQANYELNEKTIQKKVKQLEDKALKKQMEAADLYSSSIDSKFKIYNDYSKNFWKDFEGDENQYLNAKLVEEQAKELYAQAGTKRREASKIKDSKEKIMRLNEAYDLETQAIVKQVTALCTYTGVSYAAIPDATYTEPSPPATVEPEVTGTYVPPATEYPEKNTGVYTQPADQVQVNQQQIDIYNKYVNDPTVPEPIVINRDGVGDLKNFDSEELTNLWHGYKGDSLIQYTETKPAEEYVAENVTESTPTQVQTAEAAGQSQTQENQMIAVVEGEIAGTAMVPADEEVIYRVQLAAEKSEMSQSTLSKIYYGQKEVEMLNEDGWYKYSIGDFDTYAEADKFRNSCGVPGAFIVAYRKGTRFTPGIKSQPTTTTASTSGVSVGELVATEGYIFNVQIAASHAPITKEQLSGIYNGNYPVEVIREDSWYKYQIAGCRLYSDALRIKNNTTVKGVFIVAYQNGIKVRLEEAIRDIKPLEEEVRTYGRFGHVKEIDFMVQLAASKILLSDAQLAGFYFGSNPVTVVIDNGWYKYRIKAGGNYDEAQNIKAACGVKDAFIVATKRGDNYALYRAIKESKY